MKRETGRYPIRNGQALTETTEIQSAQLQVWHEYICKRTFTRVTNVSVTLYQQYIT